jgi:hypothetical protein
VLRAVQMKSKHGKIPRQSNAQRRTMKAQTHPRNVKPEPAASNLVMKWPTLLCLTADHCFCDVCYNLGMQKRFNSTKLCRTA